ncbi:hypothetical protein GCM10010207_59500 [Streptomyces atratus]|nr:hypothetical protein GCM10010207_59500 [Streptomyces atratus]
MDRGRHTPPTRVREPLLPLRHRGYDMRSTRRNTPGHMRTGTYGSGNGRPESPVTGGGGALKRRQRPRRHAAEVTRSRSM